jgi:protein-arginine deiminase
MKRLLLLSFCWLATASLYGADLDLDGDTDRDGTMSGSATEELAEATQSVILLNNCDKDADGGVDLPDNHDSIINGGQDQLDVEPLVLRQCPDLPAQEIQLRISLLSHDDIALADRVRIFNGDGQEVIGPTTSTCYSLGTSDRERLQAGDLKFSAEGLQFRTSVRFAVYVGDTEHDSLILETAPFILTSHCLAARENYVVRLFDPAARRASRRFVRAFKRHCRTADVEARVVHEHASEDTWIEDEMAWGYTATPRRSMPVALHMLRQFGLSAYVASRLSPDVGYFQAFDYPEPTSTLDFGGNLEVTPPTKEYPLGRVYYGSIASVNTGSHPYFPRKIHDGFVKFFQRQGVQSPLDLTSDWLVVGHVDEFVTFLPKKEGGFVMLLASPKLALDTLKSMPPSTRLNRRYRDAYNVSTVGELLNLRCLGVWIEDFNLVIDEKLYGLDHANPAPGSVKQIFMTALGLEEADVREVPVLFENSKYAETYGFFGAVALTPSAVNLSSVNSHCIVAEPFITEFRAAFEQAVDGTGQSALWIDDWVLYHLELGEVHCGSIERREGASWNWWELSP